MRNSELTDQILTLTREGKTQKEIAITLHKHRNTVSRHINYIRQNIIKTPEEIVNKIDDKLNQELNGMTHHDLIAYRRVLLPQQIDVSSQHEPIIIKMWQPDGRSSQEKKEPEQTPDSKDAT